jgi:hypothetical protein
VDLGQLAAVASRVGAASDQRAGGERIAVSTRLLLPLLQSSSAAPSQLAADLRAAIGERAAVTLVLPPTAGQGPAAARLEIGARQFALPPALRDALLTALAQFDRAAGSAATPAATAASPGALASAAVAAGTAPGSHAASLAAANASVMADASRAWAVAAQTTAAAAGVVGGSGATRQVQRARDDAPAPAARFVQPLFEPVNAMQAVAATSERLRQSVERSGLFFESHVAQWAQGERELSEMRSEALHLSPLAGGDSAAQRVAAQVALLQEGALRLAGPAWPGQPCTLTIEREHDSEPGGAASEPVFSARLALDLPQLGPVEVQLRVSGRAVRATVASDHAPQLAPALTLLADQLSARGLVPVLLQSVPAEELN